MSEKVKVNGFFKDLTGSMRAEKLRKEAISSAKDDNEYNDPIRALAEEIHPKKTHLVVTKVEDVSPTARMFVFEAEQGDKLPPFQAGEYLVLDIEIGSTKTSRPYSICSAPYQARTGEHPYVAITVRNGRPNEGFVSSYLYANVKVGDHFLSHLAFGQFYVEPLRDSKNIVALAGGSGITPFFSMAQEIAHGTLDADLTILYGSRSHQDIILEKELKAVASSCSRVRFVNVLSDDSAELQEGDEKGFLSAEIIKKYMGEDPTFFVCGPLPMYQFVSGELKKLETPYRRIHMEVFGAPRDITKGVGFDNEAGHPQAGEAKAYDGDAGAVYQLTVVRGVAEDKIPAKASEPLAVALERAGISAGTRCRSGACGYCRVKVLEGKFFVPAVGDGRRLADKENGYAHACSTYPLSDMKIKINIE